ncbi:hypothetical protein [Paenibacillus sp. MBLB4367]|uniref:hypothetical protein n=1 Tax=Paenibacillus sp. MBLB4367 TaxID=3384767 RepID=UPI003907F2B2
MLVGLRSEITQNSLTLNKFYYAYCEKNPNTLHFSHVLDWSNVQKSLGAIIYKQLQFLVCKGKLHEQNYKSDHTGTILPLDNSIIVPNGYVFPIDNSVLNTLASLISGTLSNADVQQKGDLLALKFLTATKSRTSVYGMITFSANLNGSTQNFVFITLCDLEKEFENLRIDESKQELIWELIKNTFKEKNLTKGLLFPYVDLSSTDVSNFVLFDKDQTLYWAEAFECKSKFTSAIEKEGFQTILREQIFNHEKQTDEIWAKIGQEVFNDENGPVRIVTKDHMKKVVQGISKQEFVDDKFDEQWRAIFKDDGYSLSVENLQSEKMKLSVKMDKVEINAPLSEMRKMKQFKHNDKVYLMISGNELAKVKEMNSEISEITWEEFKALVDE